MIELIKHKHSVLENHNLYSKIATVQHLRIFMQWHVFAVWDFMSLLKSLQKHITCVDLPWMDSAFSPLLVRLINEIVLGEESDLDHNNQPKSHFRLYYEAMLEVGASTNQIHHFLESRDFDSIPSTIKEVVTFHLDVAQNASVHEVASSFFYGREKLIPDMFKKIVDILSANQLECPTLIYYLKRHIDLDGEEHGPKAQKCLDELMDDDKKKTEAMNIALKSMEMRAKLWDFIANEIDLYNKTIS
jgi:hypothetical protein